MKEYVDKILLIITTYNQSNITRACLDSLLLISDKYDVLIIDDASTDDTLKICKEYGIQYISKDSGKGFSSCFELRRLFCVILRYDT